MCLVRNAIVITPFCRLCPMFHPSHSSFFFAGLPPGAAYALEHPALRWPSPFVAADTLALHFGNSFHHLALRFYPTLLQGADPSAAALTTTGAGGGGRGIGGWNTSSCGQCAECAARASPQTPLPPLRECTEAALRPFLELVTANPKAVYMQYQAITAVGYFGAPSSSHSKLLGLWSCIGVRVWSRGLGAVAILSLVIRGRGRERCSFL
jgi:hypothetical protein